MSDEKALIVFGTRPEAIKLAPVVHRLRHESALEPRVVITAQHREMLDQVLEVFSIRPDYDLDVMRPNQHPLDVMQRICAGLRPIIVDEEPRIVIVQGDTTTTFAAALTSFHERVPIAHVEAGLRTHDMSQPFPEEMNRRLTSSLTQWHFAPTPLARENLLREGIAAADIRVTGNTVIDALQYVLQHTSPTLPAVVQEAAKDGDRLLLVTLHRRENWGQPAERICRAIKEILEACPKTRVAFSVHKNPAVRDTVFRQLSSETRISLLEPLDYVTFTHLMAKSYLILSDSGGVQEEAPSLGKPVLVLRDVTERPEGVDAGVLRIVGTQSESIISAAVQLLRDEGAYEAMARRVNPYGDGQAADRIVTSLEAWMRADGMTKSAEAALRHRHNSAFTKQPA